MLLTKALPIRVRITKTLPVESPGLLLVTSVVSLTLEEVARFRRWPLPSNCCFFHLLTNDGQLGNRAQEGEVAVHVEEGEEGFRLLARFTQSEEHKIMYGLLIW